MSAGSHPPRAGELPSLFSLPSPLLTGPGISGRQQQIWQEHSPPRLPHRAPCPESGSGFPPFLDPWPPHSQPWPAGPGSPSAAVSPWAHREPPGQPRAGDCPHHGREEVLGCPPALFHVRMDRMESHSELLPLHRVTEVGKALPAVLDAHLVTECHIQALLGHRITE